MIMIETILGAFCGFAIGSCATEMLLNRKANLYEVVMILACALSLALVVSGAIR